jgi:4-hydroxy-3-methylbut-2-enyl diphosphate reductase
VSGTPASRASLGSLLVLAPLRAEALALRAGLPREASVLRTGMGRDRALAAVERARALDPGAVVVSGVCGAVERGLEPGDVVVATELHGPDGEVKRCAGATLLARALERRGLRVRTGPLLSLPTITGREERRALRGSVLAVDMESAWLAGANGDRPFAVARVVVDTADRRLRDPRTLVAGARALGALRRAAPGLAHWGEAVAPRTVLLAGPRSFCAGVERAIEIVERALEQRGAPVYVRKQIVHNAHVVGELEQRGAVFVDELDEVPDGATVIFSAHGVSPQVKEAAAARPVDVIDATCPLVNKVHAEARRFAAEGRRVFLIGHAGHEEVEGTTGEAPGSITLVQAPDEVAGLEAEDPGRVAFLTQTTLAVDETMEVVDRIRQRFPALVGPSSDDICYATQNRQQALKAVARETDLVLVVGSTNSSNSVRLVEVAQREGTPAYLVDDERDIDLAWLVGARRIGVTAGASAPERLVRRVIDEIAGLGPVHTEERTMTTESIQFNLPREVTGGAHA